MYVPDRCKTTKMCDKVILENGGMLGFFLDYYSQTSIRQPLLRPLKSGSLVQVLVL